MNFKLASPFQPAGDQPSSIRKLSQGVANNHPHQVLLGVTGSGKTFTIANVIQKTNLPTLIISHNKTLAAQLYQEFRDFFPRNAVSYFISYYDYYQPEAYIPSTDTYIEKDTQINDEIDKLRLSSTTNLLTRPDCIVIASVSSIYNLGSPIEYGRFILEIIEGQIVAKDSIFKRLIDLRYDRSDTDLHRGSFRVKGDTVQLWPAYQDQALNISFLDNKIESITPIDPISGKKMTGPQINQSQLRTGGAASSNTRLAETGRYVIYPAKHYLTDPKSQPQAITDIRQDLKLRLDHFNKNNQVIETHRLKQKVNYDLEMIEEFGFVSGIENYSRYFDGRSPGQAPYTLLDYFNHNCKVFNKPNYLTIVDESHITIPQIRGMYRGDRARKQTLIDFGFRLPSALDNRPLKLVEFLRQTPQLIYTSATPSDWEISQSQGRVIEQLVRPTGLLDPQVEIRPTHNQIQNLVKEIISKTKKGQRVLVTTLTKRMAEDLTEYLNDEQKLTDLFEDTAKLITLPKVAYLHSDIKTLDRSDILDDLRLGKYDVLVGINLLREGLDLPEVSLVAILDADKEGFLRSTTSLIQTMGRAARHQDGQVILYADNTTNSMKQAIKEVSRRRQIQEHYNQKHNITPTSIKKPIRDVLVQRNKESEDKSKSVIQLTKKRSIDLDSLDPDSLTHDDKQQLIPRLARRMNAAARDLDFELAARLRDTIQQLK